MRQAFSGLVCIAAFFALTAYNTWPFVGGKATTTSTPSLVLQPWAYVAGNTSANSPDMGATPDAYLIQSIDWNQEPIASTTYCGVTVGPANCVISKYTSQLANHCGTTQESAIITWMGLPVSLSTHETAMQHIYPTNPTPQPPPTPFRVVTSESAPDCAVPNPQSGAHPLVMNPLDSDYLTELETLWPQSGNDFYPPPYNVYEDNSGVLGQGITGGNSSGGEFSTEYSCGWNGGSPCAVNVQGNGTYKAATDYDTALGGFVNSACGSPCLSMILNGGSPEGSATSSQSCSVIVVTTCHDKFTAGDINNTYEAAYDNVVAANSSSNLLGFDLESPFFSHVSPYSTSNYCSPTQCDTMLNTFANLYTDTGTGSIKLYDAEPTWGAGGIGDITGGIQVRTFALGAEWLFSNPSTGVPDRVVARRLVIGGTTQEAPAFAELLLTPFAYEHATTKYVWNGTTVTNGGGCPSASGDTGGIIPLLQQCAAGDNGGIYVQQGAGIRDSRGNNYGKWAVIINTSFTDTFTILSTWFTGDKIGVYGWQLALSGGELTCVPYTGVNDGDGVNCATNNNIAIPCTNATYCTGSQTVVGNTVRFNSGSPGTIGPDSAVILLQNN